MELDAKIPNNVNLSSDPKLRRALEKWQPHYLDWWKDMGPEGFQEDDVVPGLCRSHWASIRLAPAIQ